MRPREVKPAGAQGRDSKVLSRAMSHSNQPTPRGLGVAFAALLIAMSLSALASDGVVIDPIVGHQAETAGAGHADQ